MAINTNTNNSRDSSPRISFSGDVKQLEDHQRDNAEDIIRLDKCLLSEFKFWVNPEEHVETVLCPADELFFNGVIIPTQMRDKLIKVDEEITSSTTATLVREEINKSPSKSFWRSFRRSSSCSSGNNKKLQGSIWTSLPLLLRSKSTGSSSLNATTTITNHHHHEEIKHNVSKSMMKSSSTKNAGLLPPYYHHKGTTSRKISSNSVGNGYGNYSSSNYNNSNNNNNNNNMRNGQVLNVPPSYIAKGTSDLLGLSSLFGSKDKKTRKI